MAYPRFRLARAQKIRTITTGNFFLNSTTWVDLATEAGYSAAAWDLAVEAQEGDIIEVGMVAAYGNEAVEAYQDVATVVAGSPVNYVGCDGGASSYGVRAWTGYGSVYDNVGGSAWYTLAASDISSGKVTARWMGRTPSAVNRTIAASAASRLILCLKNLGPADPE